MMSEEEIKKARTFCKLIKERTGHDFSEDNPALPVLMVLYQTNMSLANQLEKQTKANQGAFDSIMGKINPVQYEFAVSGAAQEFQDGITRRWLYAFTFFLVCGVASYLWWLQRVDLNNAKAIMASKTEIEKRLLPRMKEENGELFLEFDPTGTKEKGYVQYFSEFQRQENGKVRVLLGKKDEIK